MWEPYDLGGKDVVDHFCKLHMSSGIDHRLKFLRILICEASGFPDVEGQYRLRSRELKLSGHSPGYR